MNRPYRSRLISVLCIVLFTTGLIVGLPTQKARADGTSISLSNMSILKQTCDPADVEANFTLNVNVSTPDATAQIRYSMSAPGLDTFDKDSTVAPDGKIGPGPTVFSRDWGIRHALGGSVPPSTSLTVTYYDVNSSAKAGFVINCSTGSFSTFSSGGSGGGSGGGGGTTSSSGGAPVTFFDPQDGRVDPNPGDRMVIWCNSDLLVVYGVNNTGAGFFLTTFVANDLVGLTAQGKVKNLGDRGTVSIGSYGSNKIWVAWFGGPVGADAKGGFFKAFPCVLKNNGAPVTTSDSAPSTTGGAPSKTGGVSGPTIGTVPTPNVPANGLKLTATVNTYRLRLHIAPFEEATKSGVLEFGKTVTLLGRDQSGFWLYVSDGQQAGWVRGIYLNVVGDRFKLPILR